MQFPFLIWHSPEIAGVQQSPPNTYSTFVAVVVLVGTPPILRKNTLPETNIADIALKKNLLKRKFNLPTIHFQVFLLLVSGRHRQLGTSKAVFPWPFEPQGVLLWLWFGAPESRVWRLALNDRKVRYPVGGHFICLKLVVFPLSCWFSRV